MAHSTELKKLTCDSCPSFEFTEATRLDDGAKALRIPQGWRIILSPDKKIGFRCGGCWNNIPTGEFAVGAAKDKGPLRAPEEPA